MHLPCFATGYPKPNITWTKGSGNSIFDIDFDGFKYGWSAGSLIILNPSIADAGRYTCTAENQYSNDTRSLNLIVQGEFVQFFLCFTQNRIKKGNAKLHQGIYTDPAKERESLSQTDILLKLKLGGFRLVTFPKTTEKNVSLWDNVRWCISLAVTKVGEVSCMSISIIYQCRKGLWT